MTTEAILVLIFMVTVSVAMPVAMYGPLSRRHRTPRHQFGRSRRTRHQFGR